MSGGARAQLLDAASRLDEGIYAHLVDELDLLMRAGKEGDELIDIGAKVLELFNAFAHNLLDLGLWKPAHTLSVTPMQDGSRIACRRIIKRYHGGLGGKYFLELLLHDLKLFDLDPLLFSTLIGLFLDLEQGLLCYSESPKT